YQGLEPLWMVDPGRRSQNRFALGYFLSGFQPFEFGWCDIRSTLLFKHPHLRRRANRRIFRADGQEAHVVTEATGNTVCPSLKLRPRPLEAMVAMTRLASRKRFPSHLVFPGGRRN